MDGWMINGCMGRYTDDGWMEGWTEEWDGYFRMQLTSLLLLLSLFFLSLHLSSFFLSSLASQALSTVSTSIYSCVIQKHSTV